MILRLIAAAGALAAMTVLSLFFLLKDGPSIRSWAERHLGLPTDVAHTISGRTLQSLRGYFLGVTIVAVFSAVLVGGGALALGVPLAGTSAVVTFIGGYVPYLFGTVGLILTAPIASAIVRISADLLGPESRPQLKSISERILRFRLSPRLRSA